MTATFEKLYQAYEGHIQQCAALVRKAHEAGLTEVLPTPRQVVDFLSDEDKKQFRFHNSEECVLFDRIHKEFQVELDKHLGLENSANLDQSQRQKLLDEIRALEEKHP